MADKNILLKRKTSSGTDNLYPETKWSQIDSSTIPTDFNPTAHTHGNINDDGQIGISQTIASGDHLVIADNSASNALTTSSITFGTGTTTFLRNDGTWGTPAGTADTNNYLTGVSGSGDGTVTFTRQGLSNLTWDASHSHSEYAPLASPAFTGDVTMSGSLEIAGDLEVVGNTIGFVDNNFDARIQVSDSNPNGTGAVFDFYGDGVSRNATLSAEQFDGNAATTTKWLTPRTITLGGDLSGSVSLDGSANVTLSAQVANNSHQHSQLYENSTITYGASYLQWTDQSGNGGAGTNGAAPGNPTNEWWHHLIMNHANNGGYYFDLASAFHSDSMYFRRNVNGSLTSWRQIFHDTYHPNADKWTTPRTITLGGDLVGNVSLDGSANVTLSAAVANDSHTHDGRYYTETETNNLLAAKAPLASPALTGNPTAPTPTAGDDDTSIATTAFVSTAIDNLVNGASASFDTLKEIQDAMATDTELANAIAGLTIGNGTQTISAGTGLSGGGSFTANQTGNSTVTLNLDLSEFTDMTADVNGLQDELILLDAGAERRKLISEIKLSQFNNDAGWAAGDITNLTAGGGLTGGGSSGSVTISHADTSSQASVNNSGRTYIQDITLDTYGHITGITSATETVTDTNTVTSIRRDNTGTYRTGNINLVGGSNVTITETASGVFSFAATDTNTQLSTEQVQDIVGGMVSGNSESGISVTYQDTDGTLDFNVNDPTITLTGAVTGSATMTNLGNVSIATTATADPTLTLSGDASGSATFTNLGNATLSVTVANDSHTHDGRYYTETETNNLLAGKLSTTAAAAAVSYVTSCPTSNNTTGMKVYVGSTDCSTKYSGWLYLVT